jgi:hypothetical protein
MSLAKNPSVYDAASARFVLAMTQRQQGDTKKAKVTLAEAQQRTRQLPTLELSGDSWRDWLLKNLLRCEAEALFAEKKADHTLLFNQRLEMRIDEQALVAHTGLAYFTEHFGPHPDGLHVEAA